MMTAIFVFIKCELGHANDVAADVVDNVEHVSEVYSTSGQYDLLAKFQLPKDMDIGTFVTKSVQTRANIRDTFTVITFSPFLPGLAGGELPGGMPRAGGQRRGPGVGRAQRDLPDAGAQGVAGQDGGAGLDRAGVAR